MAATKDDVDQLDAILDRLDDHARAHPDAALDAIAGDLTGWYKRMFRPSPPPAPSPDDLARLDAIHARLAGCAGGPTPFDPRMASIQSELAELSRSMRRDATLAAAVRADTLARVQGALDRLDFHLASREADPGLVARIDALKAALGLALGSKEAAGA